MSAEQAAAGGWLRFRRMLVASIGALVGALACFLVLPILQAIAQREGADLELRSADTVELPPPPPPIEEEPEQQKQDEPPPPELSEEAPPLDLSQLELALNPGFGAGDLAGDFAIQIQGLGGKGEGGVDDLFDLGDLDQKPRPVYQQQPRVTAAMKKRMPCTVYLLFTVTEDGRVENPSVQSSDDAMFDAPALAAIKQWKFEPGKRRGQSVSFRMRLPMTFK